VLQQRELELPPDHGGPRHQFALLLFEAIELAADESRTRSGRGSPPSVGDSASRAAPRIASITTKGFPWLMRHACSAARHRRGIGPRPRQRLNEVHRLPPRQRAECHRRHVRLALKFAERPLEHPRID
jgi:hypothetical protein